MTFESPNRLRRTPNLARRSRRNLFRNKRLLSERLEERALLATFNGTAGSPLAIDLNDNLSQASITAGPTSYTLTLISDFWTSTDIGTDAVGFGSDTLTV